MNFIQNIELKKYSFISERKPKKKYQKATLQFLHKEPIPCNCSLCICRGIGLSSLYYIIYRC